MNSSPDQWATDLFARLVQSDWQIALVVTGGGSGAISHCFRRQGASKNFVEAAIPYSRASLESYLGAPPADSSASTATARQAASSAYKRAETLGTKSADHAVGLAMLAVLPTDPPRPDVCRICVAMQTSRESTVWSTMLDDHAGCQNRQKRQAAESIADQMVLNALAHLLSHRLPDTNR
ncbi:MAG: CinA family protein [Rubripirellula sp.]